MNKDKTIEKRAGFTQGPWTSDWVGTKPNGSAVVWLGENTNKRIAVIGTGRDEANARLIANSPAIYEQCKLFERMLASWANHDHWMMKNCNMLTQLREILANVDGGDEG